MNPKQKNKPALLWPVILSVPSGRYQAMAVRERVKYLSQYARRAVELSARQQGHGLRAGDLEKDDNGAPRLSRGCHWSLTHKPEYVGGVVSPVPVGIDLEKIRPCSPGLFAKVADEAEWGLTDLSRQESFFRYWTAKEAVLKAAGIGLRDLSKCRVVRIPGPDHLILRYQGREWQVMHFCFDDHVAAVTGDGLPVQWTAP